MNNLMIDIETMGTNTNAPIVAIGAVFFDPSTGELGQKFYCAIDLDSAMKAGGIPDGDTIIWWLKQSSEARAAISIDATLNICDALSELNNFISRNNDEPKYLKVWGNGATFDNAIVRSAYERCDMSQPWAWFNDRDVRTVVDMGIKVEFNPKRDMPFDGDRHNALADAVHQARYVSAIIQRLLAPYAKEL
ncbi:3'-5' exonuclease [Serratia sp. MF2]|uniref:3'-5' exonuclease n=1 Tax=Serratia sp. MF2 TaxID=3059173 RepID=UPI0027EC5B3D|nr:3'-5' exonuclease [Serratia sp. MF2]MDQ7101924.1 3'-5' exonuclease [Serratia sp. MF2]